MCMRIQIALMGVLVAGLLGVAVTHAQQSGGAQGAQSAAGAQAQRGGGGRGVGGGGVAGGIGGRGAAEPTLWLPDDQFVRWPYSDPAYSKIDGFAIKGYINEITAISRKSRDAGKHHRPHGLSHRHGYASSRPGVWARTIRAGLSEDYRRGEQTRLESVAGQYSDRRCHHERLIPDVT